MKYVKNFARLYALLKDIPGAYEGLKEQLVSDHTKLSRQRTNARLLPIVFKFDLNDI